MAIAAWAPVAALAAWLLFRVLGLDELRISVALISFTPWVALASPIAVVFAIVLRKRAAALAAGALVLCFALLMLPRAFGGVSSPDGEPAATARILAINVEFGEADPAAVVALARELDADALAVEELTPRFAEQLGRDGIADLFPHQVLAAAPRATGTGLYLRAGLRPRASDRSLLPGGFRLVRATVAPAGAQPVEIAAVHTVPPTSGAGVWEADLAALPRAGSAPLRVLAGDFNATLDHEALRDVIDGGYEDAAQQLGEGLTFTWPTDRRILPALFAIDHVLADDRIGISEFSAHDVAGTDHRAVFAELVLPALIP